MPVLSPHRSSSSGLSGSYRSTFSSSALDRPFYSSTSYSPRFNTYSERYTSRSFTDSDGRRIYTRSGSITEDGVTTRFREESREPSLKRDSISRDSGISSIRENSISDYPRRESSLTRSDRLSHVNVIDSVAELRNKYSPANYVPACMRKNENLSRSKSNNDIGLPPLEVKSTKKKVNDRVDSIYTNSVAYSNNTNTDNLTDEDDNGNRTSVADLCKRFDDKLSRTVKNGTSLTNKTSEVKSKISELTNGVKPLSGKTKTANVKKSISNGSVAKKNDASSIKCQNNVDVLQSNSKLEVNEDSDLKNGTEVEREEVSEEGASNHSLSKNGSRVNNFSSYISISTKDFQRGDENQSDQKNDMDTKEYIGKVIQNTDLSTSPKVTRTAISPSNSIANSLNSNSLSRRSSERENHRIRDYSDDDSSGERVLNSYATIRSSECTPQKSLGLNGLKNIGNTCFMNSVLQCLSNTRWLLEYLKKDGYIKDINTSISSMKGALIKAFAEVIKELWSEDASDRVVNTASLKGQIQRFAPRFMGYAQQDAQEFLRYLLEGLHEDVNRVQEKPKPILTEIDEKLSDNEKAQESWTRYLRMDNSRIVDHFVGQLKSTLKCTHCGHCSVTFDPFWDLSLPIPQRTGQLRLSQCLDSFTREETLDGDEKPTCSKCKERRRCTKSFSIHKFPKILVIHLKRFSPTERFRGKLNVTVDFPMEGLDMSQYAADNVSPCRYNLYAISNHSGTTYSGHYTAYCRHPYTGHWHEYNDSRVSSISSKSLVSGEAYVLFYEQEGAKSHL
ncbi:ubiquitin carboxyl-terminal hydrolase Usp2 isoform X1 [Diabrotica virgifera virgifera]|uniref:Ubiquitin carboxyl-terminal hydrolase n=1 Tax=Diabrotica virgifera virgifera TaxID=50390 RepID=A0A6P7F947_DIAVI|nr:ubiquitin carboxyl-terminal hydrolase Usp2 isoform X1 [Diabrotica virgifera virgifera]XP_028130006.1 ubiquitin carboxyl-terminal hydrolase Usp2 isoform X1 [Diabrotica virgifera virgifera]